MRPSRAYCSNIYCALSSSFHEANAFTDILPFDDKVSWGLKSDGGVHSVAADYHVSN